jgi:hypothetical protein
LRCRVNEIRQPIWISWVFIIIKKYNKIAFCLGHAAIAREDEPPLRLMNAPHRYSGVRRLHDGLYDLPLSSIRRIVDNNDFCRAGTQPLLTDRLYSSHEEFAALNSRNYHTYQHRALRLRRNPGALMGG